MPTYAMRCTQCDEQFDVWRSIHAGPPESHTNGCGGPLNQIFSVPVVTGHRTNGPDLHAKDRQFEKDAEAYKRLRGHGLQPKSVDGSAELEARAESPLEVERKRIVTEPKVRRRMDRVDVEVREAMGA